MLTIRFLVVFLIYSLTFEFCFGQDPSTTSGPLERAVDLSWEPIPGAVSYELEVSGKIGAAKNLFPFPTTEATLKLAPDIYEIRIRSIDKRKVPGEWGKDMVVRVSPLAPAWVSPSEGSLIKFKSYDQGSTELKWSPIPGARFYKISIKSTTSEFTFTTVTQKNEVKAEIPIEEKFNVQVTSLLEKSEDGDSESKSATLAFATQGLQLKKPRIKKPESDFIYDISWIKVDRAESYAFELSKKGKDQKWELIAESKNTTSLSVPLPESYSGGTYKLTVKAYAKKIRPSLVSTLEFPLFEGQRSAEAYEAFLRKQSLEKPSNFYFVASYLITSISYTGQFRETNQNSRFSALGGTGRLGVGFVPTNKNWGTFGIIDLSGFLIGDKNNTFPSVEIHGLWKKYISSYQLRVSGGVFARALPEVVPDASTEIGYLVKNISGAGPHLGFDLWKPLTPKLGIQFNWHVYQAMTKIQTPNSQPLTATSSHQIGLLGSYRYSPRIMAYAGYANRVDQMAYQATPGSAGEGQSNSVSIAGHYLNLLLEVSF